MSETHKINRIVYEVNFNSEQYAYDFQAQANTFVQSDLVLLIDEVLCSLDQKDQVAFIDKIEIDLGRVSYENSETEIKNRLREELTKALREKLAEIKQIPVGNERIVSKERLGYEHLIYFLEKGNLPWNNNLDSFQAIEKELSKVLKNNRKDFVRWLKTVGKDSTILLRIINQFNDPQINEIVAAIDPTNAPFIIGYSSDVRQGHKRQPLVPLTETDFRRTIWEIILAYMTTDRGSQFNKQSFIEYTIRQLAASQNIDYGKLLQELTQAIVGIFGKMAFQTEFPTIISDLAIKYNLTNYKKEIQNKEKEKEQLLSILQRFLNGEIKSINFQILKKLAREFPTELIELLLHYIAHRISRKTMVEIFSEEQVKWIIQVIEPKQCEFIFRFAERISNGSEYQKLDSSKEDIGKVKWQIILTTLYEERGSQFNHKSFIKNSIQQLAGHYNISYKELVINLQSAIAEVDVNVSTLSVLNEALSEINNERHLEEQQRLHPDEFVSKYLNAYELYNELLFYLENGFHSVDIHTKFGVYNANNLILKLENLSPELTQQFLIHVKSPAGRHLLIKNCSDDFICLIFKFILQKDNHATEKDAIEFVRTLKEFSQLVINISEYYALVLKLITDHHLVDFSKIITDINCSWDELVRIKPHQAVPYVTLKYHLISLLKNNSGSQMCNLNYNETWKYLSVHYKNDIFSIVRYLVGEPQLLKLFIQKTPDWLFFEIFRSQKLPNFTVGFIQHYSVSYMLKQQNIQQRNLFWQIVIETIFNSTIVNVDAQLTEILIKVVASLNSIASKKEYIRLLQKDLGSFSISEKQKMETILQTVSNKLYIKLDVENRIKADELKKQALLLLDGIHNNDWNEREVFDTLTRLMKENPVKVNEILLRNIQNSQTRLFWIKHLPESLLRRIFFILFPKDFIRIQSTLYILWETYERSVDKLALHVDITNKWQSLFDALSKTQSGVSFENLIRKVILNLLGTISPYSKVLFMNQLCKELDGSQQALKKELYRILVNQAKVLEKEPKTREKNQEEPLLQGKKQTEFSDEQDIDEVIYIKNAGLVLAAPYLPMLFKRLQLTEDGIFKNREAAERAIFLLQYMVNKQTYLPEFMLLLNKIVCGIQTGIPIIRGIEITAEEEDIIHQLLQAMIQNWKAIGNTSVKGFQESFLQRDGSLQMHDGQWKLQVEAKAYDMLLDQLTWSYNTIKYSWMKNILYVQWR